MQAIIKWWRKYERKRGAGQTATGFEDWFHGMQQRHHRRLIALTELCTGIISRKQAEDLLKVTPVGCYLTRISETRYMLYVSARDGVGFDWARR
jgi:hypothetical protein